MAPALREKILDLLTRHNNMTIATIRPDGYPQATTVGYVNDGLDIYFGCSAQSQKAQNLALDSKVSIAIDRDYENWDQIQGLSLAGTAARITDAHEIEKAGALLLEKFPQAADFGPEMREAMAVFRVTPSVISVLDYTKGFGHSDLVTV
jgi:general stress protein 26